MAPLHAPAGQLPPGGKLHIILQVETSHFVSRPLHVLHVGYRLRPHKSGEKSTSIAWALAQPPGRPFTG